MAEIVDAARRAGMLINRSRVYDAAMSGALPPVAHRPLRFDEADANAWLNALLRSEP